MVSVVSFGISKDLLLGNKRSFSTRSYTMEGNGLRDEGGEHNTLNVILKLLHKVIDTLLHLHLFLIHFVYFNSPICHLEMKSSAESNNSSKNENFKFSLHLLTLFISTFMM